MQVGGTHYKTGYEHWDLMIDAQLGNGWLVGSATKYVARWRNKNGLEDLRKALHYVQKLRENWRNVRSSGYMSAGEIARFVEVNKLGVVESNIIYRLLTWKAPETLDVVYGLIQQLIAENTQKAVPLEDSNKHAERE